MTAPTWLAASVDQPGKAGQVNQFLGAHAINYIYQGAKTASQDTAGSGAVNSDLLYVAQSFNTAAGQTKLGRVSIKLAVTGTPNPLLVGLWGDASGPGTLLVGVSIPHEFLTSTAAAISIPLPDSVAASTKYWIVAQAVGDSSNYYSWSKSNQTSGASQSSDGLTWTSESYGLLYDVYDQTVTAPLAHTYEDGGDRWTALTFNSSNEPTKLLEYTAGQTLTGYAASNRTLAYSSGILTGVS